MSEKDNRPFIPALLYERDGDLNLSWLFVLIMGLFGAIGFIYTVAFKSGASVVEIIAAWSFLGAAFASVLIAAIPIAKAKILANSRVPGEIASGIASAAHGSTASTDIQEIWVEQQQNNSELG